MPGPGPITAYIAKKLYNMEKSGNQGKVGNPDTSPAPMSVGGINQEPKPMKMDNKPMYGK